MRKTWDQYFMDIAHVVSSRATCDRKHVGAVIVRDRAILTTGYNGSIPGEPHCDDVGHLMEDGHCVRTSHAEVNAIYQAAKNGVRLEGATVYTNTFPCWGCFKSLAIAGIKRIVYDHKYRVDDKVLTAAQKVGIELVCLEEV